MKELIEKILTYLPQYFSDLVFLLTGPKAFIRHKDIANPDAISDAVAFFGVSIVISFLMQGRSGHQPQTFGNRSLSAQSNRPFGSCSGQSLLDLVGTSLVAER